MAISNQTDHGESLPEIDSLTIERRLGSGATGDVYMAWDRSTQRSVAVKLLRSHQNDTESQERFFREVRAAANVDSPFVAQVFSAGQTSQKTPYLTMELISGGTLQQWISQRLLNGESETGFEQVVDIIHDAALGLADVHHSGLVHRDIKPSNILIDENQQRAKLSDFGVAKSLADGVQTLTQATDLVGTLGYMSPEQATNATTVDLRADIYSLGATLYHALTGEPIFRGTPQSILKQIADATPVPPRQINNAIPADLETICLKALAKTPSRRYGSAKSFAADLNRYRKGQPIHARRLSWFETTWLWCQGNPGIATSIATTVVLTLALAIVSSVAAYRLSRANERIRQEEQTSKAATDQAIADRAAAIQSLTTLVDSVYSDLANDLASIKARHSVVNAAMNGLASLQQLTNNRAADRTAMLAHHQLGDLHSLRGDNEASNQEHQAAITMARQLVRAAPTNRQAQRDLAQALDSLILHRVRTGAASLEPELVELKATLRSLLTERSDDLTVRLQLSKTILWEIDHQRNRTAPLERTIELGRAGLELLEPFADQQLENVEWLRRMSSLYGRMARAELDAGRLTSAQDHLDAARKHLDRARAVSPTSPLLQFSHSIQQRLQGVLFHKRANNESAVNILLRVVSDFASKSSVDSDDGLTQRQLAGSRVVLCDPLVSLGRYDEANDQLDAAIPTLEAHCETSPSDLTSRTLLAEAMFKRNDVLQRQLQWAATWKNIQKLQSVLRQTQGTDNPKSESMMSLGEILLGAQARFGGHVVPGSDSQTSEGLALFLVAFEDAHTSVSTQLSRQAIDRIRVIAPAAQIITFDELFDHFRTLPDMNPAFQMLGPLFEARTLSLRYQALRAANLTAEAETVLRAALARLGEFATLGSSVSAVILNEPDLQPIRDTDAFRFSGIAPQDTN